MQGCALGFGIYGVDLLLDGKRMPNGGHYAAIRADVVQSEAVLPAILQPLLADLVAADRVFVNLPGNRTEILGCVDVQAFVVDYLLVLWVFMAVVAVRGDNETTL